MRSKNEIPISGKAIKLYCDDFMGNYEVHGTFVDYKKPIKKGKRVFKSRFCKYDSSTKKFESAHDDFKNSKGWEYIDFKVVK